MGHERVGTLPRTVSWRQVVGQLEKATSGSEASGSSIAAATIGLVNSRFEHLHRDPGVQAAFGFLVAVARASPPTGPGRAAPDFDLPSDATPLRLAVALNKWVDTNAQSREYAELAKRSAAEALASWHQQQSKQLRLFEPQQGSSIPTVWSEASTGGGFSEISRLFFASFTERYLRYFIEREASAVAQSIESRERLAERLHSSIDLVSRHAFETSKIAQSFAAGWFNKNARHQTPQNGQLSSFLRIAFGKIREELRREAKP